MAQIKEQSGLGNCVSTKRKRKPFSGIGFRNRQIDGHKFVRQQPIDFYVCDFVCRDRLLVIEVDGGQHADSASDKVRDHYLQAQRYRVIRFWNNDVLSNIEGVLTIIHQQLQAIGHGTDPLGL